MEILERAITEKGKVLSGGVLKVGAFLNNQIDVNLISAMGKDIYEKFKDCGVTKILTVEASGIAIAVITAQFFNCNAVFAKKNKTANLDGEFFSAKCFSFTHKDENTLIVPITLKYFYHADGTIPFLMLTIFISKAVGRKPCGRCYCDRKGISGRRRRTARKGSEPLFSRRNRQYGKRTSRFQKIANNPLKVNKSKN